MPVKMIDLQNETNSMLTKSKQTNEKFRNYVKSSQLTLYYYSIQCYHTHSDCSDKRYSVAMDTLTTFDCSDTDWTNSPNSNLNYKGTHTLIATKKKPKNKMENIVENVGQYFKACSTQFQTILAQVIYNSKN